jgi:hypothetical protein
MDEVNPIPMEFLHANTTYAQFRPGAVAIDPAGFRASPKDPLKEGDFLAAPPSPAFLASRLDAVRPIVNAASLRVKPVVEESNVEAEPSKPRPAPAPAPGPVVIVTQASPPQPPPPPEIVEVPVAVPAGIVYLTPARGSRPAPAAVSRSQAARKYRNAREEKLATAVLQKLESKAFEKALTDLNEWVALFPDTEFAADRTYYYMLAFNGLEQPARVVERSVPLFVRPIRESFPEAMQALSVVYLVTTNYLKLTRPARDQTVTAASAARAMLALLPACFSGDGAPQGMTAAEWAKSRTELEKLARETLARAGR